MPGPPPAGAPWWSEAPELLKAFGGREVSAGCRAIFRMGDGFLDLGSEEPALRDRFARLYGECAASPDEAAPFATIRCTILQDAGLPVNLVKMDPAVSFDSTELGADLFGDRGYLEIRSGLPGWRFLGHPRSGPGPILGIRDGLWLADRRRPWQALTASHLIDRVLRLQRGVVFFHAASASVGGRGLLLMGPKGSGKSTLSLALAARGHGFLGDEIAAVRTRSSTLLPFRRSASIRRGPRPSRLEKRLQELDLQEELFPDGTWRTRASVGRLFPGAPSGQAPLAALFFLEEFSDKPRARRLDPGSAQLGQLTPLSSTLRGEGRSERIHALMRIVVRTPCYALHPGDPDATAELIESLMESS